MSAPEIYLILDAGGTVREAIVGAPPPGAYPAGWTSMRAADAPAGAWFGWITVGGKLVDPNAPKAPTPADLLAYANAKRKAVTEGVNGALGRLIPVTIASGTYSLPIDATTRAALGDAAFQTTLPGGDQYAIPSWLLPNGQFVALDAPAIMTFAKAVASAFQAVFDAQKAAFAGIAAGTITTTAQVDAAYGG